MQQSRPGGRGKRICLHINSLAPEGCVSNFTSVFFKFIAQIDIFSISHKIVPVSFHKDFSPSSEQLKHRKLAHEQISSWAYI